MALNLDRYKSFFQWKSNQKGQSEGITLTDGDRLEDLGDADSEASMTENEESSIAENCRGQEQNFSVARWLCFAASLLLCVFTVFVFAFLLPCHQPLCHKTNSCPLNFSKDWSVNFTSSIPSGVHFLDVTGNGHLDVLVEATKVCQNVSCTEEMTALGGDSGESLWAIKWRPDRRMGVLICSHFKHPSCLLAAGSSHLMKIDVQIGSVQWLFVTNHTIHAYKFVKDVDGDGVQDVVVLHDAARETPASAPADKANISIVSGTTGSPLGVPVSIPGKHNNSSILVVYDSLEATQFILVGSVSQDGQPGSLWAISTADLVRKVCQDGGNNNNSSPWGPHLPDHQTGFITLFNGIFVLVTPLLADVNSDGVTDLVVCVKDPGLVILALHGKTLHTLWKMSLSSVGIDRLIVAGMSKENNHVHIAVTVTSASHSAELWVVDGQSGDVIWSFHSDTVFPVLPVSMHNSPAQQLAFLMWLPKSEAVKYFKENRQNQRESFDKNSSPHFPHYNVTSGTHKYGIEHQRIAQHSDKLLIKNLDPEHSNSSIGTEKRNAVQRDSSQGATYVHSSYPNCSSASSLELPMFSAFLVSHDGTIKVQQVTSERAIYLDPQEFEGLFDQKMATQRCVKLVPRNVVEPVVGSVDGSEGPQLVYAVDFVTEESVGSYHLMKIKKLNIQQAVNAH